MLVAPPNPFDDPVSLDNLEDRLVAGAPLAPIEVSLRDLASPAGTPRTTRRPFAGGFASSSTGVELELAAVAPPRARFTPGAAPAAREVVTGGVKSEPEPDA